MRAGPALRLAAARPAPFHAPPTLPSAFWLVAPLNEGGNGANKQPEKGARCRCRASAPETLSPLTTTLLSPLLSSPLLSSPLLSSFQAPRRAAAARRPVYDDPSDGDDASVGSDFSGSGDDSDASDDFGGGGGGSKKGKAPTAAAAPPKAKPAAAKKKAAAPPKKPTAPAAGPSSVNTSIDEEDGEDDARPTQATAGGTQGGTQARAVEDVYQKKSQLEHILLRPDTYVGSTERQVVRAWVHDGDGGDGEGGAEGATPARGAAGMQCRDMSYVPGLYKIFDEILVNAADNKVRDGAMDCLRVDVEPTTGWVRVWNNGAGVPVEVHKGEGVYVPELIFGHLLTSSNYNDAEQKVTGGRNGYGAKLANIFSTEFVVETCDGSRRRSYKQVSARERGWVFLSCTRAMVAPPPPFSFLTPFSSLSLPRPVLPRQHDGHRPARPGRVRPERRVDAHLVQAGPGQVWDGGPGTRHGVSHAQAHL